MDICTYIYIHTSIHPILDVNMVYLLYINENKLKYTCIYLCINTNMFSCLQIYTCLESFEIHAPILYIYIQIFVIKK
jgi:hypothetical protein